MEYCLSYDLNGDFLSEAAEIKLPYQKIGLAEKILKKYKKLKYLIIVLDPCDIIDWNVFKSKKLICAINNIEQANTCKEKKIKFYYNKPIKTY